MSERRRLRAAALSSVLVLLALGFSGCTVSTRVSLSEPTPGRGTIAVSVELDHSALAAVGGLGVLQSQLSVTDLTAAGWSVAAPSATPGGGALVAARHGYSTEPEAGQLLAQIAGPALFQLHLSSRHTFWRTYHRLSGTVDLTCGLSCFGDAGLKSATGSPVGVDPGSLAQAAGQEPSSAFRFALDAALPGSLQGTNATGRGAGTLGWELPLGRTTVVTASTTSVNRGPVIAGIAAGGVLLLGLFTVVVFVVRRRRRRRRDQAPPEGAAGGAGGVTATATGGSPSGGADPVTPPS